MGHVGVGDGIAGSHERRWKGALSWIHVTLPHDQLVLAYEMDEHRIILFHGRQRAPVECDRYSIAGRGRCIVKAIA